MPCAPVLTQPQVIEHEQIKTNELLYEYDHPGLGRVRQPRGAARFSAHPPLTDAKAPMLGQHSTQVLAELGYRSDDIQALREQGVVGRRCRLGVGYQLLPNTEVANQAAGAKYGSRCEAQEDTNVQNRQSISSVTCRRGSRRG